MFNKIKILGSRRYPFQLLREDKPVAQFHFNKTKSFFEDNSLNFTSEFRISPLSLKPKEPLKQEEPQPKKKDKLTFHEIMDFIHSNRNKKETRLNFIIASNKIDQNISNNFPIRAKKINTGRNLNINVNDSSNCFSPTNANPISVTNWKTPKIINNPHKAINHYFSSNNTIDSPKEVKPKRFNGFSPSNSSNIIKTSACNSAIINNNIPESNIQNQSLPKIIKSYEHHTMTNREPKPEKPDAPKKVRESQHVQTPAGYYNKNFYYYAIYPDNCGYLIKKCFGFRTNWKEVHTITTNKFNLKWRDCAIGMNYSSLTENQMVNHFEFHSALSNKAKMFLNFLNYCSTNNKEIFQYVPFTIILNLNDQSYTTSLDNFKVIYDSITEYLYSYDTIKYKTFHNRKKANYSPFLQKDSRNGLRTTICIPNTHFNGKNYWVIKAPNLNRGRCVKVVDTLQKINQFIRNISVGKCKGYSDENEKFLSENVSQHEYQSSVILLQKYIEKPLLYQGRKFDIRIWVLITHKSQVFVFKEGHLKACSVEYDLNNINSFVHLTNYSLQKYNENFSKYEKGNEISFQSFQKFLDEKYGDKSIDVKYELFPKIKEIIEMTAKSVKTKLNPSGYKNCFEVLGYDFMMDEEFNVFLIEINTNPGLEESSELIKKLVPRMIDDALRLTVDDVFHEGAKFDKKCLNEYGSYKSQFEVDGYDPEENLWELVCDLNGKNDDQDGKNENKKLMKKKKYKIKKKS